MQQTANAREFRPREDRRRTVLPARVRNGAGWTDACVLNISSHGLMIYAKTPVQAGSHVELRRGGLLVVARVVWRKNHRIGLRSHDRLAVEDIISSETAAAAIPAITGGISIERRNRPRDEQRSRARSRAMEFISLALVGTALAGAITAYAVETLRKPVSAVEAALDSR